jgi:hypothetical protein
MAINFTALNAALNKIILPSINAQMYERAPAWQLFGGWNAEEQVAERANVNVDRFENNKMYIPIRSSYHSGVVSVGVSEKYRYGNPTINETYSEIRTIVGSFTIPKQVLNVTDAGAIVKPLTFYSQSLSYDLAMDANRQVYGTNAGVVATTASAGSSSTTVALTASTNGDIDYSRYLPEGTYIIIGSNDPVAVASVTGDNTITIASAQSWDAGANIVKATGSDTASSELDGLEAMVAASGSYQNLNSSSVNSWKSYVNSTSETVTESNISSKLHTAFFKAHKIGKVDWLLMNATAFRIYGESLEDRIRATQKEVLSGGWIGVDYMGGNAKVLLDYDNPDDRIYLLSSEDLVFGQFQPLEFEKGTDGNLLKIAQKLDYEVTASWMGNIGTTARGAHALLSNKTFSNA